MKQDKLKLLVIAASVLILLTEKGFGQGSEWKVLSLKGKWKFSIGDDKKWARPDFNDRDWEEIYAPSPWEEQGFYGYDGYAWYRKHFYCPASVKGKLLTLNIGRIDDVDEVYINGRLMGQTGSFPPDYATAYDAERKYTVPESLLKMNADNVISIRVYDAELGGGIMSGDLGLFARSYPIQPEIALDGFWKFRIGDDQEWKDNEYSDRDWKEIIAPAFWETQGYRNYDGYAWYRKKIFIPASMKDKQLVLMLGKIDDKDETFFNGRQIGQTGDINGEYTNDRDYQMFRGYFIPKDAIKYNSDNIIAVRVYDGFQDGGIYSGPIGITTRERYSQMWKKQKGQKSFWELLFGN